MPDNPGTGQALYMIMELSKYGDTIIEDAVAVASNKARANAYIAWYQRFHVGSLVVKEIE